MCGQRVFQIAHIIRLPRSDQGKIRPQRGFEEVGLAINIHRTFAFGDGGTNACGRQNPTKPIARRADPLDQSALRGQFHLDLARDHLGLRFGVQPDMRGDQPFDSAGGDQLANAQPRFRGVIGNHRQIPCAPCHQRVNQAGRRANPHESADMNGRAVLDQVGRGGGLDGMFHTAPPNSAAARAITSSSLVGITRT